MALKQGTDCLMRTDTAIMAQEQLAHIILHSEGAFT